MNNPERNKVDNKPVVTSASEGTHAPLSCETLSVSQVVGVGFILLVWYSFELPREFTALKSLSWALNGTICLNIAYYFFMTWDVEESLILELRTLRWPFHWVEWILRLFGFVLLCLITLPQIRSTAIASDIEKVKSTAALLVALYVIYIIWDFAVKLGAWLHLELKNDLHLKGKIRSFLVTDTLGLVAALCLWGALGTHGGDTISQNSGIEGRAELRAILTGLAAVLFILPLVLFEVRRPVLRRETFKRIIFVRFLSRLFDRGRLR